MTIPEIEQQLAESAAKFEKLVKQVAEIGRDVADLRGQLGVKRPPAVAGEEAPSAESLYEPVGGGRR